MADYTIVNNSSTASVNLQEFYKTLDPSETITVSDRDPGELAGMPTVLAALAAKQITIAISYTADELASGLLPGVAGATPPLTTEEFTNVPIADDDAFVTSIASSASITTLTGTALDGVVGQGTLAIPRNVTITTSSHADIDAVDVVVTGVDVEGQVRTDTITLTDAGNTTDAGTVAFVQVTSIVIPAQSGTGGALEIGTGDVIGLSKPLVARAGLAAVIREVEAGSVVTTGTFVLPASSGPNGTYEPATPPDNTNDYAVTYEYDPTGI